MKWRNQLLALFCLFVFAGFGVLYFRYWVVQKPFGIILFIGEGLTPARLAALRMYAANAETPLTLDSLRQTALLKNYSNDSATPDSAAAATAIATGLKVNNGTLGVDAEGNTVANLLELARASGRTTGLITDSRLTNATPAAFYAHTGATDDKLELARTLIDSAKIDIVLGGGSVDFLPDGDGGARSDGRDLLTEADGAGYDLVRTRAELEAVAWWRWPKVFGVFGPA
ncbi:MAG TPA: alkaline phosphatase, partial [Chthoniobacterales bacterium]|nr:alkaline phosphatase [Chthoniobacterales bacterium]